MINHCIRSSFFWLTVVLVGHVVASMLLGRKRRDWFEVVALSLGIGTGLMGLLLFWVSLAGFKPSFSVLILIAATFGIAEVTLHFRKQRRSEMTAARELSQPVAWTCLIVPVIAISACTLMVVLHAVALPVYEWDSFSIWALKAKVVATVPLNPQPTYFHDVSLSYSHLDYPLLVPFLMSGIYGAIGEINDQLGKTVFPVLYIAFGLQLFSALRWKLGPTQSLILTALGMSVPTFVRWSGAGVSDVALSLYYIGALFYLLKWREEEQRADLILSILFGTFAAFTKNEGLPIVLLIGGIGILFGAIERSRGKVLGALSFVLGVLLLSAPWLGWSHGIPRTHENYGGRLHLSTIIENSNRLGVILFEFLRQTWMWSRWGCLWFLLILGIVLGRRAFSNRTVVFLWLLLVSQLALYALVFVVTPWDVRELLDSALDRVILQTLPVVILLIGFHWREADGLTLQRDTVTV